MPIGRRLLLRAFSVLLRPCLQMQSINHSNGFLRLTIDAPIPVLKDGEVLIKV